MTTNYLEVRTKTWLKDSHGLFDYDASQTSKETIKIPSSGSILRKGTEVAFIPDGSSPKSGIVMKVFEYEDHFMLCPVKEEPVGLVVKKLKPQSKLGFKLSKGDVLKLGRVKLKIKEIANEGEKELNGDEMEGSVNSETTCRICFRTHSNEIDPLVSVCKCSGSMELVHLWCLRKYLLIKATKKNYSNCISYLWKSLQCDVCKENLPLTIRFNDKVYDTIQATVEGKTEYLAIEDYRRTKYKYILHLLTLNDAPFLVGRASDTDLKISDISVSRSHLTIEYHKNDYFIKDNGSKFGTIIVQKKPIQVSKTFSPVVQIGRSVFKFSYKTSLKPLKCLTLCCNRSAKVDNFPKSRTEIVWEEESFRSSERYDDDEDLHRSSGGSFFKRPAPAAPSRSATTAVPPRPASTGTAAQPGLGRVMMEGMAFGAGSEIAHQAVRGVMGSSAHEGYQSSGVVEVCSNENQGFMSCLQFNKTDISQCQSYFDLFKQCKGML